MTANGNTGLLLDEAFAGHYTGRGHPERPARLTAIRQALDLFGLRARCRPIGVRDATDAEILAVHDESYIQRLRERCATGARHIDTLDSAICPDSYRLARLAVGGVLNAVDAVMAGELRNAFCAVRPPGHHCERSRSLGFCLLGNVAIAAQHLLEQHKLSRVAVLDWDVHHGNGTQHLFENTVAVFVCSLHGHPAYVYPGTGFADERGVGAGEGATLNVPFYPGAGDGDYRKAFDEQVLPALDDYRPEFLLVSAGFDAHRHDPLAPLNLDSSSFKWMTQAALELAERWAGGRVVSVLEGGYDLTALGESAALHVAELLRTPGGEPEIQTSQPEA